MFELIGSSSGGGLLRKLLPSADIAMNVARFEHLESFEIIDIRTETQIYCEYPKAVHHV